MRVKDSYWNNRAKDAEDFSLCKTEFYLQEPTIKTSKKACVVRSK